MTFVVDSASFKQNKYTPGTHIPIVSLEFLKEHEKDTAAILIMAASYSDEVARIVKQMCGNMAVGILRDYGVEQIKD